MDEIIFNVRRDQRAGGYIASALGCGIHTQGETVDELRERVREAVDCFFDETIDAPSAILLRGIRNDSLPR